MLLKLNTDTWMIHLITVLTHLANQTAVHISCNHEQSYQTPVFNVRPHTSKYCINFRDKNQPVNRDHLSG